MKYLVIAAMMVSTPAVSQTPCEIAANYQSEMWTAHSDRVAARQELSRYIAEAATKETADKMAGALTLVLRMARDDLNAINRTAPLREALHKECG